MPKRTTLFYALGFILLWNSGFIGAEYGLPYAGPFTLLFWRYLALSLLLFIYLKVSKRFHRVGWKAAAPNMLVGVLSHGVWLSCVLLALDYKVPAGIVALVVALQPLATGALSGLITGERTQLLQWLGLGLGFTGVAIPIISRINMSSSAPAPAYFIPLGAVIAITIASLIQRRMELKANSHKLPVDLTLFYQSFATMLVLALPAIFIEHLITEWKMEFIYVMLWLILPVSLGAYALMWLLIARINAMRVASLFYLGPPVTMLMAWLAFDDKIRFMDITGFAIVLIGVVLAQMKGRKKAKKQKSND